MVVFTCNHCGDTLQKPKVAKHYQFRCRNAPFLTCADCLKDFRGEEYNVHTKCLTEAERYGGKDYVSKPNANKGERKQQEWICVVSNLLNGTTDLSKAERNFLQTLSKYENIPRKKAKFFNFVRSAVGNRVNMTIVETVWDKMETAHKQSQESVTQTREQDTTQTPGQNNEDKTSCIQNKDFNRSFDNQNIVENQNNENICKENGSSKHHNGNSEICETNGDNVYEKKSKKRRLKSTNDQIPEDVQPATKISKTSTLETNKNENSGPFDWRKIILDVVQTKNEISLKKLQSKVIKKYKCHVSNTQDVSLTDTEREEAIRKFNKTLKKMKKTSVINILEDTVKLAPLVE